MNPQLIELADGILIEVEPTQNFATLVDAGSPPIEKVDAAINKITPVITKLGQSIAAAWHELNKGMTITETEIEIGLSFEAEGNIYVTKATGNANLKITLTLKPQEDKD